MIPGYPCRWLAETASTNDVARDWALAGAPDGALVVAGRQTRGKGRRGRQWVSPAGAGVYASFILRPDWPAMHAPALAIWSGLAVYRALANIGLQHLRIKWPNDVLARGRKIAGILVEPRIGGDRMEFAVAGIGINVRMLATDFRDDLRPTATSCLREGHAVTVDQVLKELIRSMPAVGAMPLDAMRAAWIAAGAKEEDPEL